MFLAKEDKEECQKKLKENKKQDGLLSSENLNKKSHKNLQATSTETKSTSESSVKDSIRSSIMTPGSYNPLMSIIMVRRC